MEEETKEMKQVKEKEGEHMYHVLEGPTTIQVGCICACVIYYSKLSPNGHSE